MKVLTKVIFMKFTLPLLLVFMISCQIPTDEIPKLSNVDLVKTEKHTSLPESKPVLEESFEDTSKIGRKSLNKIEVARYKDGERNFVIIKFYSKKDNQWVLKNDFQFDKDDLLNCDTKLSDFNNDGLKDMSYISTVAARGANEVRRLFIYDKEKDELVYIKNSENYPNIVYNKDLDCLDAWLFHGATTTVFLKIEEDKLREFASVDTGLYRTVNLIDKDGNRKLISKKKLNDNEVYQRYKNYNPPKIYR